MRRLEKVAEKVEAWNGPELSGPNPCHGRVLLGQFRSPRPSRFTLSSVVSSYVPRPTLRPRYTTVLVTVQKRQASTKCEVQLCITPLNSIVKIHSLPDMLQLRQHTPRTKTTNLAYFKLGIYFEPKKSLEQLLQQQVASQSKQPNSSKIRKRSHRPIFQRLSNKQIKGCG